MVILVTDVCVPALHMDNQPCKMNKGFNERIEGKT